MLKVLGNMKTLKDLVTMFDKDVKMIDIIIISTRPNYKRLMGFTK